MDHCCRAAVVLVLVLAVAGVTPPAVAQDAPTGVSIRGEAPEGFAEDAVKIMRQIEGWRGALFVRDVVVDIVPPEERFGKTAGWYEPATKRLVVVRRGTERFQRGTLLHEIFHALQDQRFDLAALQGKARDADMGRAIDALIEGEAMYAVAELMKYDFRAHAKLPAEGPLDEERFHKLFRYGAGQDFVRALVAAGGFAAVDEAFRSPPRSTAAIFHPEQYVRKDALPDPLLPEPAPAVGERRIESRRRGEYELRLLIARNPGMRPELAKLPPLRGDVWTRFGKDSGTSTGTSTDTPRSERIAWLLAFEDEAEAALMRGLLAKVGDPVMAAGGEGNVVEVSLRL